LKNKIRMDVGWSTPWSLPVVVGNAWHAAGPPQYTVDPNNPKAIEPRLESFLRGVPHVAARYEGVGENGIFVEPY
jgi:hypothetical protein